MNRKPPVVAMVSNSPEHDVTVPSELNIHNWLFPPFGVQARTVGAVISSTNERSACAYIRTKTPGGASGVVGKTPARQCSLNCRGSGLRHKWMLERAKPMQELGDVPNVLWPLSLQSVLWKRSTIISRLAAMPILLNNVELILLCFCTCTASFEESSVKHKFKGLHALAKYSLDTLIGRKLCTIRLQVLV